MHQFPPNIKFKYAWRKYQKRVLDELEEHLDDNHLHIIAPPGSGKTVLGIQVALKLDKPTLILAPTIAIRNQWIQRFCELFLQCTKAPDWISRDIKRPKFFTVATYQALHACFNGIEINESDLQDESEMIVGHDVENNQPSRKPKKSETFNIIESLKGQNVGTIIADEAHHLKNAWWKSLMAVKTALNPCIVGLTATPPFDVSHKEWQRYIELNGPVDAEISVPELVKEGDLCPHQDYVFFSAPTKLESKHIEKLRNKIHQLFHEIELDESLIFALEMHPAYLQPEENIEWIYSNLDCYSSMLIFLNGAGRKIDEVHLQIIGDANFTIPILNYDWIERLLTFYLYEDPENFEQFADHQEELIARLKLAGALEKRAIHFTQNPNVSKLLGTSTGKLKSIEQVVDFEYRNLQGDLRMVILTDYIRKEFLIDMPFNALPLNKMGVLPIFEKLRRSNDKQLKIAVLTGSLIIIPATALETFKTEAASFYLDNISTSPLPYDPSYLVINASEKLKSNVIHVVTQVFKTGKIEVLVGTKALLGEGWDAPFINSLILASFVGSYVLSNQMRGRAIRTDQNNPSKTGNIWHLVCVDSTVEDNGNDLDLLKRRFKAFIGVSFKEEASIENGFKRLNIPEKIIGLDEIDSINNSMLNKSAERSLLKEKWNQALYDGNTMVEEIKLAFPPSQNYKEIKTLHHRNSRKYFAAMLSSGLAVFGLEMLVNFGFSIEQISNKHELMMFLLAAGGAGVLGFGRLGFKTAKTYVKFRDINKDLLQIAETLLASFIKIGAIQTTESLLCVKSQVDEMGNVYCHLDGGTSYEKSLFINSLQEIIDPIESPKYLLIRKSNLLGAFAQKDYHAVPEIIGRKKEFAEHFAKVWAEKVGPCELVYTRTIEGRKLILKSRLHSLSAQFQHESERINKWV